jgi:MoxR-like ATPase
MSQVTREVELAQRLAANLETCILGKKFEIRLLLTALLAEGHVLLEDVPGTGKTMLIKALAQSIQGNFRRIQCNPDLLPTDITGVSMYHPKTESFVYRPGPVMSNILLVDEVNRATTKTQSALLEAMEERHVTVDGDRYELPTPFMLLATQNPIDFEGTYRLPEAQLDRFMLKFSLGYPSAESEKAMIGSQSASNPLDSLQPVTDVDEIIRLQEIVKAVYVDASIVDYIVDIVTETRKDPMLALGASPRASLALTKALRAYAFLNNRDYVLPDDVKELAPYVLCHRLILRPEAAMDGMTQASVLNSVLQRVKVPVRMEK